jgi:hypothetical protein
MPYIEKKYRVDIDVVVDQLAYFMQDAGTLNYAITRLTHRYIEKKGLRYANLNEVVGMIECMKMELYRVVTGPYEDQKMKSNGPVGILPIESEKVSSEGTY